MPVGKKLTVPTKIRLHDVVITVDDVLDNALFALLSDERGGMTRSSAMDCLHGKRRWRGVSSRAVLTDVCLRRKQGNTYG